MSATARLSDLGLTLPTLAAPVGAYVPARRCGALIFTSGQLPMRDGKLIASGHVIADVALDTAQDAARIAVLNALAAAAACAGGLDHLAGIVRLGVFVNSSPGFTDQAKVANGASDVVLALFGDAGRHARAAVGVAELPLNAAVEIELLAEAR